MSGRDVQASRLHVGAVMQVVQPAPPLLMVELPGVAPGLRIGPLRCLEQPAGAVPYAVGDQVLAAELVPASAGYVVLGRIAT